MDDVATVVLVGANGSGKSRLGVWIEENKLKNRHVHRISAQRALKFADAITQKPIGAAENMLFWGNETHVTNKRSWRWGDSPTNHVLNDYDTVLSLLYAKDRNQLRFTLISLLLVIPFILHFRRSDATRGGLFGC